jgi:hypothetical protein
VINYFENISQITNAKTYLFVYNSCNIKNLRDYFHSYRHKRDYQQFDHDTFQLLPDEITGVNYSYHLKKDYVVLDRDTMGYSSYYFEDNEGTEISALQNFYISVYSLIEEYNEKNRKPDESRIDRNSLLSGIIPNRDISDSEWLISLDFSFAFQKQARFNLKRSGVDW